MDTQNLENYINKCIADACTSTSKKNDVRYQYRIIGNHLLFAIKSRYQDVKTRVEFRLLNNLQKNFGLDFNNRRGKSRLLVSGMKAPAI